VAPRRRETELSLERPLTSDGPAGGVVRLTLRFEPDGSGAGPSPRELSVALDTLKADMEALLGLPLAGAPASSARTDRPLPELIDTYRPRQRELVDLLLDEGEISKAEHARLAEYVAGITGSGPARPLARSPTFDQPIAAVPIAVAPATGPIVPGSRSDASRPVEELLELYQIASLKQAGAVRARRQISFEEYMALKRHFEKSAEPAEKRS
jgi:hypothetical protein